MCVYVVESSDGSAVMQGIEDKEEIVWIVCHRKFGDFACKTFVLSVY